MRQNSNTQNFRTTNSVKIMKSYNCSLTNSGNCKQPQLDHMCIIFIAIKRRNTDNRSKNDAREMFLKNCKFEN